MLRAFKYRLYPTRNQNDALVEQVEAHCFLYNQALAQRKETYEWTGKGIGYSKQATTLLPEIREKSRLLNSCNYSSLQQTLRRLDKAFKAFFRRVKAGENPGYPRYKSFERFNTFSYGRLGDGCQIKNGRLYLQNIGHVKVRWHRLIVGEPKSVSITRRNSKWYASFSVESEPKILPATGNSIGIDMGLNAFLTTSDGEQIDTPKFFRRSEKVLKKAQQRLSRRKKGSKRRKKARRLVAKCHEKIANQRLDFCHKVALPIVQQNDLIVVEKLKISNMVQNRHLSKSIHDAAWGMFLRILKSKAENAGRRYEEVNPNGTSQICSSCGEIVKKSLAVRVHRCPFCGLILDRDHNAALNILARTGPSALAVNSTVPPRSRLLYLAESSRIGPFLDFPAPGRPSGDWGSP